MRLSGAEGKEVHEAQIDQERQRRRSFFRPVLVALPELLPCEYLPQSIQVLGFLLIPFTTAVPNLESNSLRGRTCQDAPDFEGGGLIMRRFLTVAAFACIAIFWGTTSSAQGIPQGTYQQTCNNVSVNGDTLIANCQDANGTWRSAQLPASRAAPAISAMTTGICIARTLVMARLSPGEEMVRRDLMFRPAVT